MTRIHETAYDIIVVGAGHAGCEAAAAAARRGHRTLLLTMNINSIALMPCNPSVGGPGKGHMVRELWALGGLMPEITDLTYLQMRMLNESKGPAVQALRAQSDKKEYGRVMRQTLETIPDLDLKQAEVADVWIEDGRVRGVHTASGVSYRGAAVVLTTGPYLRSDIIIGRTRYPGGPHNQLPSHPLGASLAASGLKTGRLQTATPPRVKKQSINYEGLRELPGDRHITTFTGRPVRPNQHSCFLTATTERTIELVQKNLGESPLVLGNIVNSGPKHCPSIDRKVLKFPHMAVHGVFLEPEGATSDEIYLQGMTTSMPAHAQEEILRSLPGLENCEIVRHGYAIEYDFVHPHQLRRTLELKSVEGLYLAGQICATTGYEEAACQGFVAGINASRKLRREPEFILGRDQAYIGVLIDDLVSHTHDEPYRMTTSRAEFRLHLRYDNAASRLMGVGHGLGLVPRRTWESQKERELNVQLEVLRLKSRQVTPSKRTAEIIARFDSAPLRKPVSLADLLARPGITFEHLPAFGYTPQVSSDLLGEVDRTLRYEVYLDRLDGQRSDFLRLERIEIPSDFDYTGVLGLDDDSREVFEAFGPTTVGQASRLTGVSREDVTRLLASLTLHTPSSPAVEGPAK